MNNVVLIGRLTKDPELRYIPESQNAVATFTIAVDRPFSKDKQADFIRITVFGKPAENCERFLTKGRLVGIQGRLQTGSYKDKNGQMVYTTDVVAEKVEFLEWGDKESGDSRFKFKAEDENQDPQIPEGFQALEDDDDIPF
jgi:single-strand DNA-binding protein